MPDLPLSHNLGEVTCPVCNNPETLDQIFVINFTDDRSNIHFAICTVCCHVFSMETTPTQDEEHGRVHKLVSKILLTESPDNTRFPCPKCKRSNSKRKPAFEVARRECLECYHVWTPIEILEAAQKTREKDLTPEQLETIRSRAKKRREREDRKRIERIADLNPNLEEVFETMFNENPDLFDSLSREPS